MATGKRKSSVARIRLTVGTGKITVNNKEVKDYFKLDTLVFIVKQPLTLVNLENQVEVVANIFGGGLAGQAGALRQGITKALLEFNPQLRADLKKAGFITRDSRIKERKKYGLKKARKASQFSKR
ncbi:MAG: 30S ribosomal protein S9 [Clostridia bacterium]|nr:30S ribosomal protein S9 [Clostridia bacterium]